MLGRHVGNLEVSRSNAGGSEARGEAEYIGASALAELNMWAPANVPTAGGRGVDLSPVVIKCKSKATEGMVRNETGIEQRTMHTRGSGDEDLRRGRDSRLIEHCGCYLSFVLREIEKRILLSLVPIKFSTVW